MRLWIQAKWNVEAKKKCNGIQIVCNMTQKCTLESPGIQYWWKH